MPCWLLKLCPDEPTTCNPPFGEAASRWGWLNKARHYLRLITMVRAAGQTNFTALQNQIRRSVMSLPDVGVARLTEMGHTPTLHGFNGQLLPKPRDWGDWLMMSGFWFLDAQPGYTPPPALASFVEAGPKPSAFPVGPVVCHPRASAPGRLSHGTACLSQAYLTPMCGSVCASVPQCA